MRTAKGSSPALRADGQPRKRLRGADRRTALTALAEEILLAEGLEGLTIAALAARAGVARTVVYSHFRTVGEIVIAVLEAHWAVVDEEGRLLQQAGGDPLAKIERIAAYYYGPVEERRQRMRRLMRLAAGDRDAGAAVAARLEAGRRLWTDMLASEAGLARPDAQIVVTLLLAGFLALGETPCADDGERERRVALTMASARALLEAARTDGS